MFDTVYAELDCPFCGRQYRHTPLSWEQAEQECKDIKERELEHTRSLDHPFDEFLRHTQVFRARADGFAIREKDHEQEDIDAWIEIQERRIQAVLTVNPETGQPEKELSLSA